MAKVDDHLKCEHCGGVVWDEYNSNNDEIHKLCLHCGSGYSYTLQRDADNNPVRIGGKYQYA